LIPEKDTNSLADNKCNEPVPIEQVQDESRNYANACYEQELIEHGRRRTELVQDPVNLTRRCF
jgi:hypothetical protein